MPVYIEKRDGDNENKEWFHSQTYAKSFCSWDCIKAMD
jgi:hypothetical protein